MRVVSALFLIFVVFCGLARAEDPVRFEQRLGSEVSKHSRFQDERGSPVTLEQYLGKPVILNFVYYSCPNLCSWVLDGLVSSLKGIASGLGSRYRVVTVSIDPKDTPREAWKKRGAYLVRYGLSHSEFERAQWHFLTGTRRSIDELARSVGFHYRMDLSSGEYAHPSGIVVLSPDGKVSRYLFGAHFSDAELEDALRTAESHRIGRFVEQILLLCSHYQLSSSRVGEVVLLALRVLGILSTGAVLGAIAWMLRKERRA